MKKQIPFFLTLSWLLFTQLAQAAIIKGDISDENGKPLSFASIFVPQTGSGTLSNADGYYEIQLDPGSYTLVFQYLGYSSTQKNITISAATEEQVHHIQLEPQAYQLQTVEVYDGKENPANTVMRKAIAKASYHRQQLDSYTAEVYIKGSGRLLNEPFFLRKALREEGIDSTMAFTSESVSAITYTRPNTFKEHVISIYESGNANGTSPNSFVQASFYEDRVAEAVSPLATNAFAYYKFDLDAFFMDRDYGINKIKVTPKVRGENLFEGYIYIIEDLWVIHSLDLNSINSGFNFHVTQTFGPLQEDVWLPLSLQLAVKGKILGIELEYNYLATISKYQITINPDLDKSFVIWDEKANEVTTEFEKPKDIKAIEPQQELTRKDLMKMMKDYEKEERKSQEEETIVENRSYTIDSLATQRDSSYWAVIRPVPLTSHELKGYAKMDSLISTSNQQNEEGQSVTFSFGEANEEDSKGFSGSDIFFGDTYKLKNDYQLQYKSPLLHTFFNPVEGFNINTTFAYAKKDGDAWKIDFTPRYAFSTHTWRGKGGIGYSTKKININVEGGKYIQQFNQDFPLDEHLSTFVNLFNHKNYISLYEKDYVQLNLGATINDNLNVNISAEMAELKQLHNTTGQTWFPKENRFYASNIPQNSLLATAPDNASIQHSGISLKITATPWQKYRIYNGKKVKADQSGPSISLWVNAGLNNVLEGETDFLHIGIAVNGQTNIGAGDQLTWNTRAGFFPNNKVIPFAHYAHFNGNQLTVPFTNPHNSYRLLPYYSHSTNESYADIHLHYQFRKLLLTRIPLVWMAGIKENVFTNYLYTPHEGRYQELGYSLDNILKFYRIEVAASFKDGQYQDWGIFIGIATALGDMFN